MNSLNFTTPTDILLKRIENDEILSQICKTVNEALNESFALGKTLFVEFVTKEELHWQTENLLRDIYKRFGWKFVTVSYNKETKTYRFKITEA